MTMLENSRRIKDVVAAAPGAAATTVSLRQLFAVTTGAASLALGCIALLPFLTGRWPLGELVAPYARVMIWSFPLSAAALVLALNAPDRKSGWRWGGIALACVSLLVSMGAFYDVFYYFNINTR